MFWRLMVEDTGADATEYALLASLVAVALIAGADAVGKALDGALRDVSNRIPVY